MIKGFAFALLIMLMAAVLYSRFGETTPTPGADGYTHIEYSNY